MVLVLGVVVIVIVVVVVVGHRRILAGPAADGTNAAEHSREEANL